MNILVADDHPLMRQGIVHALAVQEAAGNISEAGNGEDAWQFIQSHNPEIAILDISMPGMDGLEIARAARDSSVTTRFIILTMYDEESYFERALEVGVKGYLLKENATSELLDCVTAVRENRYFVSPSLSDYLVKRNLDPKKPEDPLSALTESERRILSLLARNKTSKEIARDLFISPRTVQNHRNNICQKLNLRGPNALLQFAIENKARL